MHRTHSWSTMMTSSTGMGMEMEKLPMFDPSSEVSKKEQMKGRFADNMVHVIPLVLILCAILLWFFSHPDIGIASKDDSIIARIKNMTIDGYSTWNWTSMTVGMEDLDQMDGIGTEDTGRDLSNKDPE